MWLTCAWPGVAAPLEAAAPLAPADPAAPPPPPLPPTDARETNPAPTVTPINFMARRAPAPNTATLAAAEPTATPAFLALESPLSESDELLPETNLSFR